MWSENNSREPAWIKVARRLYMTNKEKALILERRVASTLGGIRLIERMKQIGRKKH